MPSALHKLFFFAFAGIAIGNGFTDPEAMLAYSDYTYQLGLIDINAKAEMKKLEIEGKNAIQENHFIDAFYVSNLDTPVKCL